MVKQHNLFSGKVDLLTDPSDKRAQIALAMYALQEQAGKIYGAQAPKPKAKQAARNQERLF